MGAMASAHESDNLIVMPEISATEASRRFADLLDGVEHRGERYTIVRRGRVIAQLGPKQSAGGADLKAMIRAHRPDGAWAEEVRELREGAVTEDRY